MYLGLDLGTSGLRGLLVSEQGVPVGDATAGYTVQSPKEGWSEQDPAEWVKACRQVLSELRSTYPKQYAAIKGIGVAGHMHGATLLDDAGVVIRPCILWNDSRAVDEARELDGQSPFRNLSGNIVFAGFTAPKLMWVARHEPDHFRRVVKVLLPKDYLVYWLTGRYVSDLSDASGTSWLDVGERTWSGELIEKSGMLRSQLPDLVEGCELVGKLKREVAAESGMSDNVGVVAGGADNAAAACGIGAINEGQAFLSLGTSGVLLAAKDHYSPEPESAVHTFCHALPDKWYQMGVMLSATDSLNWLASNLGSSAKELTTLLKGKISGPSSVSFLPYLSGERTPHNDVNARAVFLGMSKSTDNQELCQAVIEGVSFAMRDCLEALKSTMTNLSGIYVIGGGSNSEFWVDTLANVLNLPLYLPVKSDFGAAMGAARLAMVGTSGAEQTSIMVQPEIRKVFDPNSGLVSAYETAYQKYTRSYQALKEIA
ncbi:MAG: xylulokinase [Gammaproteobacteria bacterium]|nr:xylulokinase [Gammaproteobacteria bacterium]